MMINFKRCLGLLLAVCMMLTILPISAFADESRLLIMYNETQEIIKSISTNKEEFNAPDALWDDYIMLLNILKKTTWEDVKSDPSAFVRNVDIFTHDLNWINSLKKPIILRITKSATENDANTSDTLEKLKETQKAGSGFVTVTIYNSADAISVGTMRFIGSLTEKSGLLVNNGDACVQISGGFEINEPGRIYYPLDYEPDAAHEKEMLNLVSSDALTDTCKIGGEYTLPKTVTIKVKTTLSEGSEVYVYNYVAEPVPGRLTLTAKAKVVDGKLTFNTKMLGEFLFTTQKA